MNRREALERIAAMAVAASTSSVAMAGSAAAQAPAYPTKPVHIVVAFTPGSATDVMARALADPLSRALGQPVIVENRPGAGGTIAAAFVAKATPDGHTLLAHSSAHTVNPSIYKDLTYDTAKDLVGVSLIATLPNLLTVPPARGWKSAGDLVKAANAAPDKFNYASAGVGSGTHMNAEKFRLSAKFQGTHVPYKGTPEAMGDVMTGRVDFYFAPVVAALGLVREGKLTALAVGGERRTSVLPDLPTTQEAGYPDSAYNFWTGVLAPAGVPPAALERLNAEIRKVLSTDDMKERLAKLGADPAPMSVADYTAMMAREVVDNARIVKESGAFK